MSQSQENLRTLTDRPYFIGPFQPRLGVQQGISGKQKDASGKQKGNPRKKRALMENERPTLEKWAILEIKGNFREVKRHIHMTTREQQPPGHVLMFQATIKF